MLGGMSRDTRSPGPMSGQAIIAAAKANPTVLQPARRQEPVRQTLARAPASTAPRRFDDIF